MGEPTPQNHPERGHPERIGPYRLDHWIGAGGMGTVWRAWDERLDRPVAVKHIQPTVIDDPTMRERFRREAKATAKLNNPAIVHIYDILETDQGEWIVMELVEGESLARLLQESAPLPFDRILHLAEGIARGLAEAHAKEIVHRDLKTDNVMVAAGDEVKILDFGLAKPISPDLLDTTLTASGEIVGTAQAMSPEQVMGLAVGPASDLFSFGSVLYEMLTGRSPFKGETVFKTMDHVCCLDPPSVQDVRPETPHSLSELVHRLLAKDPAERPRGAREVVASLRQLAGSYAATRKGRDVRRGALEDFEEPSVRPTEVHRHRKPPAPSPEEESAVQPGERRQVTVICCELLGAAPDSRTSFSALDPEALFELMPDFQEMAEIALEKFEGTLGNHLGHHLWAYFGYPRAHEDSAQRAVRVALELREKVTELEQRFSSTGRSFALRTAIHTGPAVVLASRSSQLALGSTLDVAMGLQGLAEPRQIWVSDVTRRLVAGAMVSEPVAPVTLPGFDEPLAVFRVTAMPEIPDPVASGIRRAPLIARESELETLTELWQQARSGTGQVVLLSGETGIGKSRIVQALEEKVVGESGQWWMAYGRPYTRHSPLHPITELLRRLLEFDEQASKKANVERLEQHLDQHGFALSEFVPLFATLLALPLVNGYSTPRSSPDLQRERTMKALGAFLLEKAERQPAVLVVEDVHWLDPSSVELLDRLLNQIPAVSLLTVLTFRSGFEVPWQPATGIFRLDLGPLDAREAANLMEHVVAGSSLASSVQREIIAQTDGVPLFVEELTKAVLESNRFRLELEAGSDTRRSLRIPATLQDSLMARLDRLGPAKAIAQEASVIGRDFTYDILAAVSSAGEEQVRRGLEKLVASGLAHPLKGWRQRYIFQHALVRDAAYESMLGKRRREIHQRVAEVLENRSWSRTPAKPELLAHHYTEAGLSEPAARSWLEAGRRAMERSAVREGISHFERGLAVLRSLPEGPDRYQLELTLLARLGPAQSIVHGYGSSEVERTYGQAHDLCRRFGSAPQVFWILWGLWAFHLVRTDLGRALELGRKLIEIAEGDPRASGGDRITWIVSSSSVALAHYYRGELDEARQHLERAAALDPPGRTTALTSATGQDTGVVVRSLLALVLWHQGSAAEAVAMSDEAVALAERIAQPYSQAYAHVHAARLHQSLRDPARTREHAEAVIKLSEQSGFFWLPQGYFFRGCALAELRRQRDEEPRPTAVDRVAHLQKRGIETYRKGGARLSQTYMLAQMAQGALDVDAFEECRACLDEALELCFEDGERFWEGELRRLQGELDLVGGDSAAARLAFDEALELARRRGDRAFELRAALSLGRLLHDQGHGEEARSLLTRACAGVADALASVDLDEARCLLAQL